MSSNDYIKLPRLYVDQELHENADISFDPDQSHYLKNVMRRKPGDQLRLFNGREGEWLVTLSVVEKKGAIAQTVTQTVAQPDKGPEIHLIFAPIKKHRMDFMIEKAIELGATHLRPVITHYTEVRKLNESRVAQQTVEAAEQCERLDLPHCLDIDKLENLIGDWDSKMPIYACIERDEEAPFLSSALKDGEDMAILIGPEGGFSDAG